MFRFRRWDVLFDGFLCIQIYTDVLGECLRMERGSFAAGDDMKRQEAHDNGTANNSCPLLTNPNSFCMTTSFHAGATLIASRVPQEQSVRPKG